MGQAANVINTELKTRIQKRIKENLKSDTFFRSQTIIFKTDLEKAKELNSKAKDLDLINEHQIELKQGSNQSEYYYLDNKTYNTFFKQKKLRNFTTQREEYKDWIRLSYFHVNDFRTKLSGQEMILAVNYEHNGVTKVGYIPYHELLQNNDFFRMNNNGDLELSVYGIRNNEEKLFNYRLEKSIKINAIQESKDGKKSLVQRTVLAHDELMMKIIAYGQGLGSSGPGYKPHKNPDFAKDVAEGRFSRIYEIYNTVLPVWASPSKKTINNEDWRHYMFKLTQRYSSNENLPGWKGGDASSNIQTKNLLNSSYLNLMNFRNVLGLVQQCYQFCKSVTFTNLKDLSLKFENIFFDTSDENRLTLEMEKEIYNTIKLK